MENRFFRWRGVDESPTQIVPHQLLEQLPPTDVRYFVRILMHLDQLLPGAGLTFFLTWHLDSFHEAMEDAVVILVGDEYNQIPSYGSRVRVIFKTGGLHRNPVREALRLPVSVASRVLLRDTFNGISRIKRQLKYRVPRNFVAPAYDIPVGTGALLEVDPPPVEQRRIDVFFAGCTSSGWVPRARATARKHMANALAAARPAFPQHRVELVLERDASAKGLTPAVYTQSLADAKIALAPRGNYDAESWRLYEAAKLGCVMVTEPLPQRWYFQHCPAVSIPRWSLLPSVLKDLLYQSTNLARLSKRSRQWWNSTVSETAIANFIAQRIPNLPTSGTAPA